MSIGESASQQLLHHISANPLTDWKPRSSPRPYPATIVLDTAAEGEFDRVAQAMRGVGRFGGTA